MLIYDSFADRKSAEEFAAAASTVFKGLRSYVFDTQHEADGYDFFPFLLTPPIVLITRPDYKNMELEIKVEEFIGKLVKSFKGEFAGT